MAHWTIPGHERHRPLLDVVPVQLHLAGDKLSTVADEAGTALQATTGDDCGTGFPGATAAAHAALVEAWRSEDHVLLDALHSTSAKLHHSAENYAGADDDNANQLLKSSQSATGVSGPTPTPLNL